MRTSVEAVCCFRWEGLFVRDEYLVDTYSHVEHQLSKLDGFLSVDCDVIGESGFAMFNILGRNVSDIHIAAKNLLEFLEEVE